MRLPCTSGYHVPTYQEAYDTISVGLSNNITQFNTALMPPLSGGRSHFVGSLFFQGSDGYWWLSSPDSSYGRVVYWDSSVVGSNNNTLRTYGFSVRCQRD